MKYVYSQPLAKIIDVKQAPGDDKWAEFVSAPKAGKYELELPLADGVITDIADVALVSAGVVLNTTTAISDTVTLVVGGLTPPTVKITNSCGRAEFGAAAPTEDKILERRGLFAPVRTLMASGETPRAPVAKTHY